MFNPFFTDKKASKPATHPNNNITTNETTAATKPSNSDNTGVMNNWLNKFKNMLK